MSSTPELKRPPEWLQELYPRIRIVNYDGWTISHGTLKRKSITEPIDREEFEHRLMFCETQKISSGEERK